jgi:Ca2+-transporting ATPase
MHSPVQYEAQPQFERRPWAMDAEAVATALDVRPEEGLTEQEARKRRKRYGPNALRAARERSAWAVLAAQFKSLIVLLLVAAGVVSFAFGEWLEGVAIAVVIVVNAGLGFVTELSAVRSMEALRRLGRTLTRVRRGGELRQVPAEEVVPGDVLVLEGGDLVPADLRLVTASRLEADESALTGESLPVGKGEESVAEDTVLAERTGMLYRGTALTRGSGEGVVTGTGMETEVGKISEMVAGTEDETTPLEKRLNRLGRKLIGVTLVIAAAVSGAGIAAGKEVFLMVETGIALAVAAIPEGLPVVATIALARGMWRMARRNALINRLSAVETLGATSVICTDKTGTLTENRMTVTRVVTAEGEVRVTGEGLETEGAFLRGEEAAAPEGGLLEALRVAALCNNAGLGTGEGGEPEGVGDPLEVALLVAAAKAGLAREALVDEMPEVGEEAFDSDVKMMATYHRAGAGDVLVAVKGAPEKVVAASTSVLGPGGVEALDEAGRERWLARSVEMAGEGLRMLGLASKRARDAEAAPYEDLTLLALVAMEDPPREDVKGAIVRCREAGIRVIMVTGDQAPTARSIAVQVGLVDEGAGEAVHGRDLRRPAELSGEERRRLLATSVFARVSPGQKLDLIGLHQEAGSVVAMTGDGVNDAPALKKADIGVAMGLRGTQVAREAADMVLKDDAFTTIVAAVEQGRVIFGNIRKFVVYLLSCNVSEILAVAAASLLRLPLPILPLQILFLNLVTDVFPALALGVGEGERGVMERRPRSKSEPVVGLGHWGAIGGYGAVITVAVLGALWTARRVMGLEPERAVTISFLTLAMAQLWHVLNMRGPGSRLVRNEITRNGWVWGALGLCVVLLLAAVYVGPLARVLKVTDPGAGGWALAVGMSLVPCVLGQVWLGLRGRKRRRAS